MDVTLALLVLAALVLVAGALGVLLRRNPERSRAVSGEQRVDVAELGLEALGARATVVQFSTEMCARCPGVRRLIDQLALERPGVEAVHVDVTHRPDIASRFNLLQTPTVLVLDGDGRARARLTGAISKQSLERELAATVGVLHVVR